jgi:L-lactate dehydrogenase complex protein LldG
MEASENDLKEKFTEMARLVQAVVSTVENGKEIFSYAVDLTVKQNGKTLAAIGFADDDLEVLQGLCEEKSIELLKPPLRPRMEDIHTSLTPADCAIAETGTIVVDSASEDMRIATMLAETHVACVAVSGIKAESMDLEGFLDERFKTPPAYTAFITGASRTADIERVLTIGVHGPQELHILLKEEKGA